MCYVHSNTDVFLKANRSKSSIVSIAHSVRNVNFGFSSGDGDGMRQNSEEKEVSTANEEPQQAAGAASGGAAGPESVRRLRPAERGFAARRRGDRHPGDVRRPGFEPGGRGRGAAGRRRGRGVRHAGNHRHGGPDHDHSGGDRIGLLHRLHRGHLSLYVGPGPAAGLELCAQRRGEARHSGAVPRSAQLRPGRRHQLRGSHRGRSLHRAERGRDP